jgi:LPS sulfotransferase NodH
MLAATGIAGKPESYFFGDSLQSWMDDLGLGFGEGVSERSIVEAAFHSARSKGRNGTGMFGLRLQAHSRAFFLTKLAMLYPDASTDSERFQLAFGTILFVHLTRPSKIDQAVSYTKAQQTGLWHMAPDGSELERNAPHSEPFYDAARLQSCFETMTRYDREWNDWFARECIEPLRLSYDDLSLDPSRVLRLVLDKLGLNRQAATGVTPDVRKLADSVSNDWAVRLRAELSLTTLENGRPLQKS